jgi:hypothetical protein
MRSLDSATSLRSAQIDRAGKAMAKNKPGAVDPISDVLALIGNTRGQVALQKMAVPDRRCGSLKPAPAGRLREAYSHLQYSSTASLSVFVAHINLALLIRVSPSISWLIWMIGVDVPDKNAANVHHAAR